MSQNILTTSSDESLDEVIMNLDCFLENINCLKETFGYSEGSLNQQIQKANKEYEDFVKPYKITTVGDELNVCIPTEKIREFNRVDKRKQRAQRAITLIPPSYIVSLISLFDSFIAGLIRCLYKICPEKLNECNKEFSYKDIYGFSSVSEVRKYLIDCIIEDLFRKSHKDQFEWLAKMIGVKTLKDFDGWSSFIELTERRNIFVHSDGVVSSQYIKVCRENNVNVLDSCLGSKLSVDNNYFHCAYKLLYTISVNLTLILINKLYVGPSKVKDEDRDKLLINIVYELIIEKQYDVAIKVSLFALKDCFHRKNKDKSYILLNLAQAYKWNGDINNCHKVLSGEDTSSWANDLLVPKLCLEEKFEVAFCKIEQIGNKSEILTIEAYREWPIFQELRRKDGFSELFKRIFGVNLVDSRNINIQTDAKKNDDTYSSTE